MPIVRTFISFPAGVARMRISTFIIFSTAGAFVWSCLLVYAGTVLGANWEQIRKALQPFDLLIAVAVVVAVLLFVWWRMGMPGRPGRAAAVTQVTMATRAAQGTPQPSSRRSSGGLTFRNSRYINRSYSDLESAGQVERQRRVAGARHQHRRERRRDGGAGRPGDAGHARPPPTARRDRRRPSRTTDGSARPSGSG